jgi:membrane protease subunit HflK
MNYQNNGYRRPNGVPPELSLLLNWLSKNGKLVQLILLALFLLMGAYTSFYTVQPSEEAVVTRFGRYDRTTPPGLHFLLPFGIEVATKVKTKLVLQQEFGFRTRNVDSRITNYSHDDFEKESLMLTGDLNVADVEWIVQYQISDPKKYLFAAQDPQINIRDVSEAIMRRVVGDRTVNEVLTTGRVEIANDAQRLTQEVLDKYDIGVRVITVKLQDVNPPDMVKPSFNEVNAAKQEQEKAINMAEEAYNKVIPEARGKAEETISHAEGYASAVVNRAQGDSDRFLLTLKEYRQAPEVTRTRIYLETMQELFGRFKNLTIVDDKVKGLMPVFNQKGLGIQSQVSQEAQ